MNKKFYAGIGSRIIPIKYKKPIKFLVSFLNEQDYILRSGGANGTDSFFEEFANKKEIYLPWKNFNKNKSDLYNISDEALKLAKEHHPAWNKLNHSSRNLIARNGFQILGYDLNTPVEFVVCYTTDGKFSGGTGQALRIAESYNIPIYNLYYKDSVKKLTDIHF